MKQYLDLLDYILKNGEDRGDRTGTGVISSFGHQIRFDLKDGFPAVTTKSLAWKGVVSELLWFLEGSDDERRLAEIRFEKDRSELTDLSKFSTIWTDNADNQGVDLGYENNDITKTMADATSALTLCDALSRTGSFISSQPVFSSNLCLFLIVSLRCLLTISVL